MSSLSHPNIVRLLGVCVEVRPLWVIMELVSGGELISQLVIVYYNNIIITIIIITIITIIPIITIITIITIMTIITISTTGGPPPLPKQNGNIRKKLRPRLPRNRKKKKRKRRRK